MELAINKSEKTWQEHVTAAEILAEKTDKKEWAMELYMDALWIADIDDDVDNIEAIDDISYSFNKYLKGMDTFIYQLEDRVSTILIHMKR